MRHALLLCSTLAVCCTGAHAQCGDCNADTRVDILDALTAAQAAAGLISVPPAQVFDCDVDSSGAIHVLDALLIAQDAAGIPVTLTCIIPNSPPALTLDYFPPSDAGIVPFYYTVVDPESDPADVFFEFSTDGGSSWSPMTIQTGISLITVTTSLAATPAGLESFFFWDSWTDAPTTTGVALVQAWAEDLAAGPVASDSIDLTNGLVVNGYTAECLMDHWRHADMAPIPLYVAIRSFDATMAQLLQFGGNCQEAYHLDRPAFDSTPAICTLSITFVNLLPGAVHEWPMYVHLPGAYHLAPGPHEVIAVSRQLGGYIDSTPLDIVVY